MDWGAISVSEPEAEVEVEEVSFASLFWEGESVGIDLSVGIDVSVGVVESVATLYFL